MKRQVLFLCGIAAALAARVEAQTPDSGAFFVRLGNDTIAVETYVRTPTQLTAEALSRTPQTRFYQLIVNRTADGAITNYQVTNNPVAGVPNATPPSRTLTTYVGDSAHVEMWFDGSQRRSRTLAASKDMVPLQSPFYSTYETALMQARRPGGDTVRIHMLSAAGPLPYLVRWIGADSVTLYHPVAGTIRAQVDAQGRLLGLNGEQTTFKVIVTAAKWADLAAYEKQFAAADAAGRSLGPLSPRDSIEFAIGRAQAKVSYGRPSKRGRVVFGGLVPWGKVWRTGANAATHLSLSAPVEIHGAQIPAGTYSLWTIPEARQWRLIINKQTGQWGTAYDAAHDLARIEVAAEHVGVPVETFTVSAAQRDAHTALLTLTWDRTRVVIPMREIAE